MRKSNKDILIEKLYKGTCTEEEFDTVFQLVKSLPQNEAGPIMEKLWEQKDNYPGLSSALSSRMYQAILSRIPKEKDGAIVETPKRSAGRRTLLRVAASLIFLILAGIVFEWSFNREATVSTANNEQQIIELPDGSVVHLNANSTLRYPEKWNDTDERKVWLRGEAFFEVSERHASGQKFLVFTPDLTVQVLGTAFNVNTHQERTMVFLEKGAIALELKNQAEGQMEKVMVPGEMLSYSAERGTILANTKKSKTEIHTSWKDGVLTFDETPLGEVLNKVEEIYGIDLVIRDTLNENREITTGLPMEELELVLPILEQALGIKIEKRADQYWVQ
jgi:ferric-dicitrate binding protein FerR (iron transport regulator)